MSDAPAPEGLLSFTLSTVEWAVGMLWAAGVAIVGGIWWLSGKVRQLEDDLEESKRDRAKLHEMLDVLQVELRKMPLREDTARIEAKIDSLLLGRWRGEGKGG